MANQYERYLNRLRGIKASRPEMKLYERSIASMAAPYNILDRKVAQMTQAGGASTAAQVAALNEGRSQWNQLQQEGYTQALQTATNREAALDTKIAEVEFANEQYKEQKKAEKAAKRSEALRTGLQVAGMIAGAALAAPTGGMSLMMGASLGGSIGQVAGGFVGVNKKGNLSMNPEEWDTGLISQGLASTASILSTHANQQDTKAMMAEFTSEGNLKELNDFITAHPKLETTLRMQLQLAISSGDIDALKRIFESIKNKNAEMNYPTWSIE